MGGTVDQPPPSAPNSRRLKALNHIVLRYTHRTMKSTCSGGEHCGGEQWCTLQICQADNSIHDISRCIDTCFPGEMSYEYVIDRCLGSSSDFQVCTMCRCAQTPPCSCRLWSRRATMGWWRDCKCWKIACLTTWWPWTWCVGSCMLLMGLPPTDTLRSGVPTERASPTP